ncbi:MAG: DUF4476 domain-containing protein [Isosphaeraceae bacterium]
MTGRRDALAVLSVVVGVALWASHASSQPPPGSPPARRISPGQAATDVGAIAEDVAEARRLVARVGDRALRDRIDLLLARAELNARGLRDKLAAASAMPAPAVAPPVAMAPEKFQEFLAALKKNAFDAGKAQFIEDFARGQWFSCDQATTLLKEFSFDEHRVKAAVALHPRLVDPGDFFKVLDVFTFDSGKQAVRKAIGLR